MKLRLSGLHGRDCTRQITHALLQVDIGARINFDLAEQLVRIEGRLTLDDAAAAIRRGGFQVASIVDSTLVDAVFRPAPGEAFAF
jgi:hypothetical protein